MLELILQISFFALPIAVTCFAGGWFARGASSVTRTVKSNSGSLPAQSPEDLTRMNGRETAIINAMKAEAIKLAQQVEEYRKKNDDLELLLELSTKRGPKARLTSLSEKDALPTTEPEWRVIVLKQRIDELEKQLAAQSNTPLKTPR